MTSQQTAERREIENQSLSGASPAAADQNHNEVREVATPPEHYDNSDVPEIDPEKLARSIVKSWPSAEQLQHEERPEAEGETSLTGVEGSPWVDMSGADPFLPQLDDAEMPAEETVQDPKSEKQKKKSRGIRFPFLKKKDSHNESSTEDAVTEQGERHTTQAKDDRDNSPAKSVRRFKNTTEDESEGNEDATHSRTSNITAIAMGISLFLSIGSAGCAGYALMQSRDSAFQSELESIRDDLMAKIDKVESDEINNANRLQTKDEDLQKSLQDLQHELERQIGQLNDLKVVTERMGGDNELSLTWSKQTRNMMEDANDKLGAHQSALETLQAQVKKLQTSQSAISARKKEAATHAALVTKMNTPLTEFSGYKLFSIDDWGGILLVTLTKGDEVKRVQSGDLLDGWRIMSVDRTNLRIELAKGPEKRILVSSGS